MQGVLTGFAIIFAVVAVGWLLARRGVIEGKNRLMFNRVAFYASTPALIFSSVTTTDPGTFASPVVLAVSLATVATSLIYVVISRLFFPQNRATTTMGAGASSYYNSVNIGLPVSLYVLGDAAHVIPTLLVQMSLFTPIILALIGSSGVWRSVRQAVFSPIVLSAVSALLISLSGITIPTPILEPIRILGGASVPMILMSFGASLTAGSVLKSERAGTLTATALKVAVMPACAFLIAKAIGLSGDVLYAAVVLAALPTAQNIYNYAATYRQGETIARDTVFLTTFLSLPAILVIAFLFGR
ncbi:AEC family transporter [Corynebacterium tapiri]|uniref:AEC family transporter n=1 Tax=Corynebacterium tapiri TaxID=1448266 RepID=A0A5C4U4K6_9CORY|nr:AEC family transporter [Corynebacterium tapiri]TNL97283.1 AEC family transporter [Corynebacterium tapiri]